VASEPAETAGTLAHAEAAPPMPPAEPMPGAQAELPWSAPTGVAEAPLVIESAAAEVAPETQPETQPEAVPEAPPVPANDVVSGPMIQPIVIGSESAPLLERKRGWWRRR
jgi:hypothetical protein